MSLTLCPECSREISDRAAACPHCGYPMGEERQAPILYAVVLTAVDCNDPQMVKRIEDAAGITEEKAQEALLCLPYTLKRGLSYEACVALIRTFSAHTHLEIIRDGDADTPGDAAPIQVWAPQAAKPVTFGTILGACLAALALWTTVLLILALFL